MKTGVTVFSDFLSALGVKHTGAESDKAFRDMPFKSLFAQRWSGVALLAYPDGKSEEPCYRQHHLFELAETAKAWILGFCCVTLVAFGFWRSGLWHDLSAIFLLCIDLFGLYITFQLLLKSLKVNVKTADRICGVLQKHGCDTVLEQKASKFFGLFGWAEVGVEYDYGRCVNYDGRQAHDNRLQAMLQVSF